MGIENPTSGESEPLNEEAAQEEANMLRAHLQASPELGGRVKKEYFMGEEFPEHELTSEDYDEALTQLEEWKEKAEKTPGGEKFIHKLIENINPVAAGRGVLLAAEALNAVLVGGTKGISEGVGFKEGVKEQWREDTENKMMLHQEEQIFNSAESRLRLLKERGEKFGEREKHEGINES
jgi:hypothetical protein